jgi:hypothetical protein
MTDICRCGLRSGSPLNEALQNRFDQLIGWAKAGESSEYYLMDKSNINTLRDNLIQAVYQEISSHTEAEIKQ